jgi:hypothetical protein
MFLGFNSVIAPVSFTNDNKAGSRSKQVFRYAKKLLFFLSDIFRQHQHICELDDAKNLTSTKDTAQPDPYFLFV